MPAGFFRVGEQPRGFNHQVHTHLGPGYLRRISLREDPYAPAVDYQVSVAGLHVAGISAIGCIVFQEMGVGLGVGQVVYRRYFQLVRISLVGCS